MATEAEPGGLGASTISREIAEAPAQCEGHDHSSHTAAEAGNVTESSESSDTESDCGKASIVEPVRKAQKRGRRRKFGLVLRAGKPQRGRRDWSWENLGKNPEPEPELVEP